MPEKASPRVGPRERRRQEARRNQAATIERLRNQGGLARDAELFDSAVDWIEARAPKSYAQARARLYAELRSGVTPSVGMAVLRVLRGGLRERPKTSQKSAEPKKRGRPRKGEEHAQRKSVPRASILVPGAGGKSRDLLRQHRPADTWEHSLVSHLGAALFPVYRSKRQTMRALGNLLLWVFGIRTSEMDPTRSDTMRRKYDRIVRS
jgi:hypothetical protein